MAVSPFCCNQARFRRIFIILIGILVTVYFYTVVFGRVEIDHEVMERFKNGMREGFSRAGLAGHKGKGKKEVVKNGDVKPPRNIDLHKEEGASMDEPSDVELKEQTFTKGATLARNMMKHAWNGYQKYAWGEDELAPLARGAIGTLGPHSLLVSIIDSLDTLMLMRMDKEYVEARDLVLSQLSFDKPMKISMFEANIRILGGLLSAFALSGDARFVTKAFDLAQRFMFNFNSFEPFPANHVDLLK